MGCDFVAKCIAFDVFGTIADMSTVSRVEIRDYVDHVRRNDFSPYQFPKSWRELMFHPDSAIGVSRLQSMGYKCVAMSNGSVDLIRSISANAGVTWDHIIDLVSHKCYKPHVDAYKAIEKQTGYPPSDTLMVTANPSFGDLEGAAAIGMPSQTIRHGYPNTVIELAEMLARHQ